jgi:hypothetical protein
MLTNLTACLASMSFGLMNCLEWLVNFFEGRKKKEKDEEKEAQFGQIRSLLGEMLLHGHTSQAQIDSLVDNLHSIMSIGDSERFYGAQAGGTLVSKRALANSEFEKLFVS